MKAILEGVVGVLLAALRPRAILFAETWCSVSSLQFFAAQRPWWLLSSSPLRSPAGNQEGASHAAGCRMPSCGRTGLRWSRPVGFGCARRVSHPWLKT